MQIQLFDIVKFTKYPSLLQKILAYFKLCKACEKSTYFLVKDDATDKTFAETMLFANWVHRSKRDRNELYRLKVRLTPTEVNKLKVINDGSLSDARIIELIRPSIYNTYEQTLCSIVVKANYWKEHMLPALTEYKKIYDSKKG